MAKVWRKPAQGKSLDAELAVLNLATQRAKGHGHRQQHVIERGEIIYTGTPYMISRWLKATGRVKA